MTDSEKIDAQLNVELSLRVGVSRGKIKSYQAINRIIDKYEKERDLDEDVNGGCNSHRLTCCIEALLLAQKEVLSIEGETGLVGAA